MAAARGVPTNADLPAERLDELAPITKRARRLLRSLLEKDKLTGRGLHRVRRVACTLADLAGDDGPIDEPHVGHALQLRVDPGHLEPACRVTRRSRCCRTPWRFARSLNGAGPAARAARPLAAC